MLKDLFDDLWLVNEADNPHLSLTLRARERVGFVDFPDKVGPALF